MYQNDEVQFRVGPVPANWRPIEVEGTLIAFRDDAAGATVAVNGRCGKDADDVPLEALTHHLFLEFTERHMRSQQKIWLDGRQALRTEMDAALDGVPKRYTVYVLKKNGCVYDFLRIAQPSEAAETDDAFERFVSGFATVERS